MKYIVIFSIVLLLCSCGTEPQNDSESSAPQSSSISNSSSSSSSSDTSSDGSSSEEPNEEITTAPEVLPADPNSSDWVVSSSLSIENTQHMMIFSESNQRNMGFSVYLPPEYESNTSEHYPVVYFLHGKSGSDPNLPGNEVNPSRHVVPILNTAIENETVKPMIMVFINGGQFSFYSDFSNGVNMIETYIADELIPAIDNAYRTKNEAQFRAIEGFSMGGYGAMKLIAQHPDKFNSAVSYGGALHTLETFVSKYSQSSTGYQDIFNSDENIFNQNNPHFLFSTKKNELINAGIKISIFSGNQDTATGAMSRAFAEHIKALSFPITNEDHDVNCGHLLKCYYQERGLVGLQQHSDNF